MTLVELLPCPFCGGPAELDNAAEPQFTRRPTVTCANEDCFGYMPSAYFARDSEAIEAWNRRPALSQRDEHIRVLTEALTKTNDAMEALRDRLAERRSAFEVIGDEATAKLFSDHIGLIYHACEPARTALATSPAEADGAVNNG